MQTNRINKFIITKLTKESHRGQFFKGGGIFWGGVIFRGAIFWGSIFLGGYFPGDIFPRTAIWDDIKGTLTEI